MVGERPITAMMNRVRSTLSSRHARDHRRAQPSRPWSQAVITSEVDFLLPHGRDRVVLMLPGHHGLHHDRDGGVVYQPRPWQPEQEREERPGAVTATPHSRDWSWMNGHGHDLVPGNSNVFIFKNKIRKAYSMLFYPRASAYMMQYDI